MLLSPTTSTNSLSESGFPMILNISVLSIPCCSPEKIISSYSIFSTLELEVIQDDIRRIVDRIKSVIFDFMFKFRKTFYSASADL